MRTILLAMLVALGAVLGCSKSPETGLQPKAESPGTLSETQIAATLTECLAPRWKLKSVGPIVAKANNETEVHLSFTGENMQGKVDAKGRAIFMRDQSGKQYLKETWLGYNNCEGDLPKPVN
jgi:hypothetical protein